MSKLNELFADHQLYHSDFQMDNLITIRAGGTEYGQYKQALRELYKRYRGLRELYSERELLQVDIDELSDAEEDNKFEERRRKINLAKKRLNMDEMNKNISDTEREFKRFYAQALALKERIGELTDEKRAELDREMWEYRLKEMAALDIATSNVLSRNTYELICASDTSVRNSVLEACSDLKGLIAWFEQRHTEDALFVEDGAYPIQISNEMCEENT